MKRAAILVLLVAAACSSGGDGLGRAPTTTAPTATVTTSALPAAEWPPGCTPALPAQVSAIEANLSGTGNHLTEAVGTTNAQGYAIVMADITSADGVRLSSADSWLIDGATIYALSSSAQDYSILPAGNHLPFVDFSEPAMTAAEDCIGAVLRLQSANT